MQRGFVHIEKTGKLSYDKHIFVKSLALCMDKLRDFIKSWPGRILMVIFLSPMVLLGLEGYLHSGDLTVDQVAKVGDTPIALGQLQGEINTAKSRLGETTDPSLINNTALKNQTLDNLINRTLLETQASLLGMHLSDEAISRLLQADPSFADANGQFSNDLFAQYLQQNGLTKDRLFATYRNQLNLRSLMNSVLATAIYPDDQISRLIDLQTQSRPLWVKRIAWQDYADKVSISDSEISEYYTAHKPTLISAERVDLQLLAIDPSQVAIQEPSDDELLKIFHENALKNKSLAHILVADNDAQKIANIQSELNANKDFASVAKQYSDDPTGQMGGEIGVFNEAIFGADANAVKTAISTLNQGEISAPIKTQFGTHIFKVISADTTDFASQKQALYDEFMQTAKQNAYQDLIVQINAKVADGFSLKDVADEYKLSVQSIKDYPKTNNATAFNQPAVIELAFDELLISENGVSPNIDMADKTVWIQPTNHRMAGEMTLAEARPIIVQKITQDKASKLAMQDAQNMLKTLNSNTKGLTNLGNISRQSPTISDDERPQLFAKDAKDDALAVWVVPTDKGVSVFAGGKIATNRTQVMSDTEKSVASNIIKDNVGQDYLEDYLQYLREVHKVQINDSVLQTL